MDGPAQRAAAHGHDPGPRQRRCDATAGLRRHGRGREPRRADPGGWPLRHHGGPRGHGHRADENDRVRAGEAVRHGRGGRHGRRRPCPLPPSGGSLGNRGDRLRDAARGQHHRRRRAGLVGGVQYRPHHHPSGAHPGQGGGRAGRGQQRTRWWPQDSDSRRNLGQREQRPALRHRRDAGNERPLGGPGLPQPGPPQLPQSRRHREYHGVEGRLGRGDLRGERRQRRGAHNDQEVPATRPGDPGQHEHFLLIGHPAPLGARRR